MPEFIDPLAEKISDVSSGLMSLLAEAHETWQARAAAGAGVIDADAPDTVPTGPVKDGVNSPSRAAGAGAVEIAQMPGWRSFEDAFPTFYQFTNRPR